MPGVGAVVNYAFARPGEAASAITAFRGWAGLGVNLVGSWFTGRRVRSLASIGYHAAVLGYRRACLAVSAIAAASFYADRVAPPPVDFLGTPAVCGPDQKDRGSMLSGLPAAAMARETTRASC